jgi:CRP-like cAMP-binding protein
MALDVAEQFATWTPRARLAWRLLSMAKSHGITRPSKRGMEIQVSQEALASMINLSRQRTNILLKEMEREELVSLEYGRTRVRDPEAMQALLDDPT